MPTIITHGLLIPVHSTSRPGLDRLLTLISMLKVPPMVYGLSSGLIVLPLPLIILTVHLRQYLLSLRASQSARVPLHLSQSRLQVLLPLHTSGTMLQVLLQEQTIHLTPPPRLALTIALQAIAQVHRQYPIQLRSLSLLCLKLPL